MGMRMTWPMYLRREVEVHGRLLTLYPQQAEVLLALLVRRGQPVTRDTLVEVLWPDPDQQPDNWVDVIQTAVARLRGQLGRKEILTVNGNRPDTGYMLPLPLPDACAGQAPPSLPDRPPSSTSHRE